jgi:molecular chaperone HtpG
MSKAQTFSFQTEVQQLLHLMIHSLYSHKEIFLRELISNASDACDKLRFLALTDDSLMENDAELGVDIDYDKRAKTITVRDNGIGMSRDEVIENIGTIARSGTQQFVEALSGDQAQDSNLIGQFGVGFYSVFMVAEKVTLTTRKAGTDKSEGTRWESDGGGDYTLDNVELEPRGTEIIIKLRDSEKEFLDGFRLRSIVGKYSDHISLPIRMREMDGDKPKKEGGWETVNKGSALWARPKKQITEEEYQTFYTTLSYDPEPPLATIHNRVEGKLEYISLFYIPSRAPFDLWDRERRHGVKLYVRRIFIMDDAEHLMPAYLRYVRGIVDSADLPLNVSREFLQHNKAIDKIRGASVKKILNELKKLAAKDPEKYLAYWGEFGRVFKEGVVEDQDNKNAISVLLRFATTKQNDGKQAVSLDDYINRMPANQKAIYYLTADNFTAAKDSPHLEVFRKHDIEVLLLTDPIDEWVVNHLTEYQEKPLKSVAKGALDLDDVVEGKASEPKDEEKNKAYEELVGQIKTALMDRVKDVRVSNRLTDSPACLVADEHDIGANLERILKSVGQDAPTFKPILEINPDHPLIMALKPNSDELADWANVLFDQAALSEGAHLAEPAAYVKRVNSLLTGNLPGGGSRIITDV